MLSIAGTTDSVTLTNTIVNSEFRIEQVTFADGTVWSNADLMQRAFLNNSGDNVFYGSNDGETINGGAGNDTIDGKWGDDVIIGGTGDDFLSGGGGDDTYRFARGDGQDTISDETDWRISGYGGNDTIAFGADIEPADVIVTQVRDGRDLVLSIAGTTDSLTLTDTIVNGEWRIENVTFADGTIWSNADLMARVFANNSGDNIFYGSYDGEPIDGGSGNDTIDGKGGNDVIVGGTGNDFLSGGGGDDTYRFARGDGQDTVSDETDWRISGYGGNDTIVFGAGC